MEEEGNEEEFKNEGGMKMTNTGKEEVENGRFSIF